jgi:hypothetical protein
MAITEILINPLMIGLTHSAESDHVITVGNLVNVRDRFVSQAMKGVTWGIGHTISLVISALSLNLINSFIDPESGFSFELFVGFIMMIVGFLKLIALFNQGKKTEKQADKLVYFNIGFVQGLAGSGSIAALLVADSENLYSQLTFLGLFGIGTIAGMGIITAFITNLRFIRVKYLTGLSLMLALISIAY